MAKYYFTPDETISSEKLMVIAGIDPKKPTVLPDPDVMVESVRSRDLDSPEGAVNIVISRGGKGRSYQTTGGNTVEVVKDAIEKIIKDPYTGEFIKRS